MPLKSSAGPSERGLDDAALAATQRERWRPLGLGYCFSLGAGSIDRSLCLLKAQVAQRLAVSELF
jgi:hypothetical protein